MENLEQKDGAKMEGEDADGDIGSGSGSTQKSYRAVVMDTFRYSKDFPLYVKEGQDKLRMKIQINTTREVLGNLLQKNLDPKPFAMVRSKGEPNVWILSFKPSDLVGLVKLKNSGEWIILEGSKARNLHYGGIGVSTHKRSLAYFLDMQEDLLSSDDEIRAQLTSKGVEVSSISRDLLCGMETGMVSVYAVSDHKDKEISIGLNNVEFSLQRLETKLQRKRSVALAAKKKTTSQIFSKEPKESKESWSKKQNKKKKKQSIGWKKKVFDNQGITTSNKFRVLENLEVNPINLESDESLLTDPGINLSSSSTAKKPEAMDEEHVKPVETTTNPSITSSPPTTTSPATPEKEEPKVTIVENGYGKAKEIRSPDGLLVRIPLTAPAAPREITQEGRQLQKKGREKEEQLTQEITCSSNKSSNSKN
jgi:hypothetical protein